MFLDCKNLCTELWKEFVEPVMANTKTCKTFCQAEKGQWFIGGIVFGMFYTVIILLAIWIVAF